MTTLLQIPFALDLTDQLCDPTTADRGNDYRCPVCKERVILKRGKIKVPHFAHKINEICNPETVTHQAAKLLIQQVVQDWKLGKCSSPIVKRKCDKCGNTTDQKLPESVDGATLEYRLSDGLVADIALTINKQAHALLEIRVTHPVDAEKLEKISLPFIEMDGFEVLKDPMVWTPVVDKFDPFRCRNCDSIIRRFEDRIIQIARDNKIDIPKAYYRHGFCNCWKCHREIIVFAWPKSEDLEFGIPTVRPVPRTIQFRYSKTVGHQYWANTCPYCNSLQGDYYMDSEPEAPFFGIIIEEDSQSAFDDDLRKIALHASEFCGLL